MKIELDCGVNTLLAVFLIIIVGILFMYLTHFGGFAPPGKNKFKGIEHFPASLKFHEGIRRQPKALIPKIIKHMNQEKTLLKSLPDDYMYLYDYEKNLLYYGLSSGFLFGLSFFLRFPIGFAILGIGGWILILFFEKK